jgi:hypothetical protein
MGATGIDALIPVEPQPAQPVLDVVLVDLLGTLDVGVVDAEDERSTVMACEQPVEQRRTGVADVDVTRGRGSDSNPDSHDLVLSDDADRCALCLGVLRSAFCVPREVPVRSASATPVISQPPG